MTLEATLAQLEDEFWNAAGDRDRYAAALADDAVHVFPGWGIAQRNAVLDGVAAADPWERVEIDDPQVVPLGDDAAALIYEARAQRGDGSPYVAAITSVYRRAGNGWMLVVHQQTPLPSADASR